MTQARPTDADVCIVGAGAAGGTMAFELAPRGASVVVLASGPRRALGVAGVADDARASPRSTAFPLPAFPFSFSDSLFASACRATGVALHAVPQARNSVAYGGRAPCRACSTCAVCPTGAKASIDLTHIPAAEASGRARVLADATVLRLEVDDAARVSTAVYVGPDRVE